MTSAAIPALAQSGVQNESSEPKRPDSIGDQTCSVPTDGGSYIYKDGCFFPIGERPDVNTVRTILGSDQTDATSSLDKADASMPVPEDVEGEDATSLPRPEPGQSYIFIDGRFVPNSPPPTTESKSESPMDAFNARLGQEMTIELGVVYLGRELGSVAATTTLTTLLSLRGDQLATLLSDLISPDVLEKLSSAGTDYITVEELGAIGIDAALDPRTLTISIDAPPKDPALVNVDLGGRGRSLDGVIVEPSNFAMGLTSVLSLNRNLDSDTAATNANLLFSGFLNYGGIRGINLDYGGFVRLDSASGARRFVEDRTIAFIDRPERALRFEAGTLFNDISTLAGSSDFLGIGVRKSYRVLQPTRVIRPLGGRSFQLERPGEVTVLVNGREVSRFDADTGPIDLNNIPLTNISNDVQILVEDEFGRRVGDTFSVASDVFLLQPGLTEYAFGLGLERDPSQIGFRYTDDVSIGGQIQRGISSYFTQGAYAYYVDDHATAGLESAFALLNGIGQIEVSLSDSEAAGTGFSVGSDYRWDDTFYAERGQSIALSFDYRDQNYAPIGVLFGNDVKFEAAAFYDRGLTDDLRLNASGSRTEFYGDLGPITTLFAGLTYQLGPAFLGAGVRYESDTQGSDELGFVLNLTRRLGARQSVSANYDSIRDRATARIQRSPLNEVGGWGYRAQLQSTQSDLSASGSMDYIANRFTARAGLRRADGGGQLEGDTTLNARLQTGIAFAGGKFGLGRDPGQGFTMVSRHRSLDDATAEIGSRSRRGVRARSGALGPAVDRITAAFQPQVVEVDVKDAPFGYDIGEGRYTTRPGSRSGFNIQLGSDGFRNRIATFLRGGDPIALSLGQLRQAGQEGVTPVFTNRAGRALLSNLEAGRYVLTFENEDLSYVFTIDEDAAVYEDLGTIDLLETRNER